MSNPDMPKQSFTRDTVEKYYKKGDTLEINGKPCIWVKGGKTSVIVEIDGEPEEIKWSDIEDIPELGNMRIRAGDALRSLFDAGWIKVDRFSPGLRLLPNPVLIELSPNKTNSNIYFAYGRVSHINIPGEYQWEPVKNLSGLGPHADNDLVRRAIDEQNSIGLQHNSMPFAYSLNFYYFIGRDSPPP